MNVLRCTAAVLVALLLGCGTATQSYVTRKDFTEQPGTVKRVGVMIAEAQAYDLDASGARTPDAKKTASCFSSLPSALLQSFSTLEFDAVLIPVDDRTRSVVDDYLAWHKLARGSKRNNRQLADLGPLPAAQDLVRSQGLDALALVRLSDSYDTAGRVMAQAVAQVLVIGIMVVAGGSGGGGLPVVGGGGLAEADLAIFDKRGDPIYYRYSIGEVGDFKSDQNITRVCENLMLGFAATELQRHGGASAAGNKARIDNLKRLSRSGVGDEALFDEIERRLLERYAVPSEDFEYVDETAWQTTALGASGLEKYRATLQKVAEGAAQAKVRKYAARALVRLASAAKKTADLPR